MLNAEGRLRTFGGFRRRARHRDQLLCQGGVLGRFEHHDECVDALVHDSRRRLHIGGEVERFQLQRSGPVFALHSHKRCESVPLRYDDRTSVLGRVDRHLRQPHLHTGGRQNRFHAISEQRTSAFQLVLDAENEFTIRGCGPAQITVRRSIVIVRCDLDSLVVENGQDAVDWRTQVASVNRELVNLSLLGREPVEILFLVGFQSSVEGCGKRRGGAWSF